MSKPRTFTQEVAQVTRLWKQQRFAEALAAVERLRRDWPGNAHLHVQWARLVQLGDADMPSLADAERALHDAVELAPDAPGPALELGHFLDAVQDDPHGATKAFAQAVAAARRLLIEGLLGQAKALVQLDKREAAFRCVLEVLSLDGATETQRNGKTPASPPDIFWREANGQLRGAHLKGPFAGQIEDLLNGILLHRTG